MIVAQLKQRRAVLVVQIEHMSKESECDGDVKVATSKESRFNGVEISKVPIEVRRDSA